MSFSNKSLSVTAKCLQDIRTRTPKVNISFDEREMTSIKVFQDMQTTHSLSNTTSWNSLNSSNQTPSEDWDKIVNWHESVKHLSFNDPARTTAMAELMNKFNN
jgi:hypothetical protein